MRISKLSIIIPVYNEKRTIKKVISKIDKLNIGNISKEIIIIDDYSTDGTREILKNIKKTNRYKIYFHRQNYGKGSAIRIGLKFATGDVVLIQDADLEYNPDDIPKLLQAMKTENAQVVYGSRHLDRKTPFKHGGLLFYYGGFLINLLTKILYGSELTDEATGYKMFNRRLLQSLSLNSKRFEFCPEVTAKILKRRIIIHEIAISYRGRTITEGKKVRLIDGFEAVWTLLKYRFIN